MIFNTAIINGVATMTKTGAYFSIISAGGIVRVKLTKAGSTVLDSKMWVGMSINHAMPFDEVEIYGADGQIEFWAGDLSMSNQGAMSLKGANALRASSSYVLGSSIITHADLTRQSIRVRASKDITIGGASVGGSGWFLPANTTEEFPIAGSVYAYRQSPRLDLGKTTASVINPTMWPAIEKSGFPNWIHVSNDGQTRLFAGLMETHLSVDAGVTWVEHPDFGSSSQDRNYIYSRARGELWCIKRNDYTSRAFDFYVSTDDGKTFTHRVMLNYYDMTGMDRTDFTTQDCKLIGDWISCGANSVWFAVNINTLEKHCVSKEHFDTHGGYDGSVNSFYLGRIYLLNNDVKHIIEHTVSNYTDHGASVLRRSVDGGKTFVVEHTNVLKLGFDESQKYAYLIDKDSNVFLSNDGGLTFNSTPATLKTNAHEFAYAVNGVWFGVYGDALYTYYLVDGEVIGEIAPERILGCTGRSQIHMNDSGQIFRSPDTGKTNVTEGGSFQLNIQGDISPALVEVLEFLS